MTVSTRVFLPDIWNKFPPDLSARASGQRQLILLAQSEAAHALRELAQNPALRYTTSSPNSLPSVTAGAEHLGWLTLWARIFNLLEATSRLVEEPCDYVADVLERPAMECFLQTLTIGRPFFEVKHPSHLPFVHGSKAATTLADAKRMAIDRLQAFAGWSLAHDLQQLALEAEPDRLKRLLVDHADDANRFVRSTGYEQFGSLFFGSDPEIVSPQEAERDLSQAEAGYQSYQDLLKQLDADHPEIAYWRQQAESKAKGRRLPDFFKLVDADTTSWTDVLGKMGLGDLHPIYKAGNLSVHGSSLAKSMQLLGHAAILRVIGLGERKDAFSAGTSFCHQAAQQLRVISWLCFGSIPTPPGGAV